MRMRTKALKYALAFVALMVLHTFSASAQFRDEAFKQNYNDTTYKTQTDTTDKLFSFKELFRGLGHKQEIKIGTMFGGAVMFPGSGQIYNRDYWKLPIVYGGIGACIGTAAYYNVKYNNSVKAGEPVQQYKTNYIWLYSGAGLVYWASLLDATAFYPSTGKPNPGRAAIYSALLPGLGQAYNGEYWKIPVYYTGLLTAGYFVYFNNLNYVRFKRIYAEATNPEISYSGPVTSDQAKYYKDSYRRLRDYSIVALGLVYILQIIDANVFAVMYDFEVTDDISIRMEPTVITPDNNFAFKGGPSGEAVGMKIGINF